MKESCLKMICILLLVGCAAHRTLAQGVQPSVVHVDSFVQQVATTQGETAWEKFSPAGAGFSVLMPGTPKVEDQEVQTDVGKLINHMYTLSVSPNLYMVTYAEFPTTVTDPAVIRGMLDNARKHALSAAKGELKSEKEIRLGEAIGREWLVTLPSIRGIARVRAYWADRRLYQVLILMLAEAETSQQATTAKFLDSFVLTGLPK